MFNQIWAFIIKQNEKIKRTKSARQVNISQNSQNPSQKFLQKRTQFFFSFFELKLRDYLDLSGYKKLFHAQPGIYSLFGRGT